MDFEAVVGELNAGGQDAAYLGVQAHAVAHVGEQGAAGLDAADNGKRLRQRHVRHVLLDAQGVDHKQGHPAQALHLLGLDGLAVGDVGQRAYAVAVDAHLVVPHGYGLHVDALGHKWILAHFVQIECGHARIQVLLKAIWHAAAYVVEHVAARIHWELVPVFAVCPQVVDAAHVVVVDVRDEQRVDVAVAGPQHLGSEIGSAVDEQFLTLVAHYGRCAQAVVARVCRTAHLAVAVDLRHSCGCART